MGDQLVTEILLRYRKYLANDYCITEVHLYGSLKQRSGVDRQ